MVRAASGGRMADDFLEKGIVAIGWEELGDLSAINSKAEVLAKARDIRPGASEGRIQSAVSQQLRFRDEVGKGHRVVTYDSSRRQYHVGRVIGPYEYDPSRLPPCEHIRSVRWDGSVSRDDLSQPARNTLGSTLTLFRLPPQVLSEVEGLLRGAPPPVAEGASQAEDDQDDTKRSVRRFRYL